jgi:hypothetical protein
MDHPVVVKEAPVLAAPCAFWPAKATDPEAKVPVSKLGLLKRFCPRTDPVSAMPTAPAKTTPLFNEFIF